MDNLEEFCLMENSSPVADFKWSIINHQSNIYIYVCIYINIYPGNIWHINYQSKTSTKDKSNHIVLSSNPRATIWWTHYIPIIFHDMSPKKPPYFLGYIPMLDTLKFPYYVYTVCVYIYIFNFWCLNHHFSQYWWWTVNVSPSSRHLPLPRAPSCGARHPETRRLCACPGAEVVTPIAGMFMMETPNIKCMIWGYPIFWKPPYIYIYMY